MNTAQPETVLDFLKLSTDYLQGKGIESPRLNAELLLADILNTDRLSLYLKFDYPLTSAEVNNFRTHLGRRGRKEPLQYITGKSRVLDVDFQVDNRVLIPRPETEEMADQIIRDLTDSPPQSILDIGTGSGILAILLARAFPHASVQAIDISSDALEVASENARTLVPDHRINFLRMDILKSIPPESYDLIVSNPPYIPKAEINTLQDEVKLFEPLAALDGGSDGLAFFRHFQEIFPHILQKGGRVYLEGHADLMENVQSIMQPVMQSGEILKDMQGNNRFFRGIR